VWEAIVALVRLPATLVAFALATVIGMPFIIIFRVGLFMLGYVVSPLVLVYRAFQNERSEFREFMKETNKLLTGIPESIGSMYKGIFTWGFPRAS
jgi:hypothetical protein